MMAICGLRADLVPHRYWVLRRWYHGGGRYYHGPRTQLFWPAGRHFYELVDPDLRELCRLLLSAGLRTTPSCQGHFHAASRFRKAWEQLHRERECIRDRGLIVRDSEIDEPFLFRDADYRLPWTSFDSFHAQSAAAQTLGYLGVLIPPYRRDLIECLEYTSAIDEHYSLGFDEPRHAFGMELFHMLVRAPDPDAQSHAWMRITHVLERALWPSLHSVSA